MERKTVSGIVLSMLFLGMTAVAAKVQNVNADSTTLYIDPPQVQALPSESFTVDISVANVELLHEWQVNMSFNPNVLKFIDVTEGDFLRKERRETIGLSFLDHLDEGWALFSWSILGMFWVNGSGTLANVEFQVLTEGESELDLVTEPIWIDRDGDGIQDPDEWVVITHLTRMILPPIPPGEQQWEDIPFAAVDGYFISITEPTVNSLIRLVQNSFDSSSIDDEGVRTALLSKLSAARTKIETGQTKTAENLLKAFLNQVSAQSGKHITPEVADILIKSAEYILSQL